MNAVRSGLCSALNNRDIDSTLIRTIAFFLFACSYSALLPLDSSRPDAQRTAGIWRLAGRDRGWIDRRIVLSRQTEGTSWPGQHRGRRHRRPDPGDYIVCRRSGTVRRSRRRLHRAGASSILVMTLCSCPRKWRFPNGFAGVVWPFSDRLLRRRDPRQRGLGAGLRASGGFRRRFIFPRRARCWGWFRLGAGNFRPARRAI